MRGSNRAMVVAVAAATGALVIGTRSKASGQFSPR
jgi:hypothetical protein